MARIVVASVAYLGDVAPFIAPANRLVERGHHVTFLAPAGFHPLLAGERFELATYPLDFSASFMHADPEHVRLMRHPFANQLRLGTYLMRTAWSSDPSAAGASLRATIKNADAVVSHPTFASVVAPTAEHLGVPLVVGHLFPMMIPTAAWTPALGKRSPSIGPTGNRLLWRALASGSGLVMHDRQLNAYRRSLGLPDKRGNAMLGWDTAARAVMLVSRHYYGDAPPDWPPIDWGGFSPWPGPAGAQDLDPAVDAYLRAGDPPVLVTLGSSAATGAGEAFALSAGVPVVVLPQIFDQVWHAGRVETLGVGIGVWRARDVAKAVARIEADPAYTERARALAQAMAGEDGAGALVDAVESVL